MKNLLTKNKQELFFFKKGVKTVIDINDKSTFPSGINGDVSGIYGNVSSINGNVRGIYGDVSGIYGDVSGIYGNVSSINGNVSGIYGDVDLCEITEKERNGGICINDLIAE